MIFLIGLFITFLATFYWIWTWNFNYWKKRGIPGPKPSMIYGNTKSFMLSSSSYCLEVEQIYKDYHNKGCPVVGYYAGRKPHILVLDAYTTKEILIKNFTHFYNNEVADMMSLSSDPILARNPFFQKSEDWKYSRKELVPGFTINRVKTYYPIVRDVCDKLRMCIDRQLLGSGHQTRELDIDDLTGRFATDVISDVIFGVNANALSYSDSIVLEMGKNFITQFRKVTSFFVWTGLLPLLKKFYKYQVLEPSESSFFQGLIRQSVEAREAGGIRDDFLQFLVQLKEKRGLNVTGMTAHAMTFYLDGYDTSSIAMANTLSELAKHAEMQSKLRKEILEAVKDNDGEIPFDVLMEMPYLDQVINETLRVHPPIVLLVKQCTKTFEMKHPDYAHPIEIPEGTPVMFHIAAIHRDPNNFEDPLTFNPDRFRDGSKKFSDEGMFLAFGGGPRTCLGMRFALTQLKSCVCEVIQNFELSEDAATVSSIPINPGHFFNYPTKKILLNVKRLQ